MSGLPDLALTAVFLFFYFLFPLFTKIYFRFGNLQKYTPAAPLPGGRGLNTKKKEKKNCRQVPGAGRPAAGRTAPLAARQRGGRPPATLYKVFAPSPPFGLLKIQKKKKREGGRGGVRGRQSGEALSDFQGGDFR